MSYTLTSVTIRTDNTPEGMKKIGELWDDVTGGKLPILFDSAHNFQTWNIWSAKACTANMTRAMKAATWAHVPERHGNACGPNRKTAP